MSRNPGPNPQRRRIRTTVLVVLVVVMCGIIAWSQWYAVHHNIPYYQKKIEQKAP